MATILNKGTTKQKRLLNLISNPHQDILTQIDSIANKISLQLFVYYSSLTESR
jgi:hypothetical protein